VRSTGDSTGAGGGGTTGGSGSGPRPSSGGFGGRAPGRGSRGSGGAVGTSMIVGGGGGAFATHRPVPSSRCEPAGQRTWSGIDGVLPGEGSGKPRGIHGNQSGTKELRAHRATVALDVHRVGYRFRIRRSLAMWRFAAALPFTNFEAPRVRRVRLRPGIRRGRRNVALARFAFLRRLRDPVDLPFRPPIACRNTCCAAAVCCPSPA